MTVLDAYAVIALLREESAAEAVESLLSSRDSILTAVGVAEVVDHLIRVVGTDEEDASADLAQLGLLDGVPIDIQTGAAAGRLRARSYHRTRCAVSMADCIAAEVARYREDALATSDPHLLDVCHGEGIRYVVLPNSNNVRWSPPSPSQ